MAAGPIIVRLNWYWGGGWGVVEVGSPLTKISGPAHEVHPVIFGQLDNFACLSSRLLTFFPKSNYLKNSFNMIIRISNSFDPGQDQHFVSPDLGLNCLQR